MPTTSEPRHPVTAWEEKNCEWVVTKSERETDGDGLEDKLGVPRSSGKSQAVHLALVDDRR